MQLNTSKDIFGEGKKAWRHDGLLHCTLGLEEGSKKPKHVCIKGRDLSSLFSTLDIMWYRLLGNPRDTYMYFIVVYLRTWWLFRVFSCCWFQSFCKCSLSYRAFYTKNIQELHKPCYDHVAGLRTVLLHDTHLQRTRMVPLEFSLSQKKKSLLHIFYKHMWCPRITSICIVVCLRNYSSSGL